MELDVYFEGVEAPIGCLTSNEDGAISFAYEVEAQPYPV